MYAPPVQDLIDELGRLPGIGPKSAQRIAFYLLKAPAEDALRLAEVDIAGQGAGVVVPALLQHRRDRRWRRSRPGCARSAATSDASPALVCVVEERRDIVAVEKTREYRGLYHVLLGAINPIEGIGPEQLKIRELLARIDAEQITEVILCTNPNIEGDATAMYLASLFRLLPVKVTRIASGLPVGGDLEYADELTLGRALEGRRELD